jgi:hypothetical protein
MAALLVLTRVVLEIIQYLTPLHLLVVVVVVVMETAETAVLVAALEATTLLPLAAQEIHHL